MFVPRCPGADREKLECKLVTQQIIDICRVTGDEAVMKEKVKHMETFLEHRSQLDFVSTVKKDVEQLFRLLQLSSKPFLEDTEADELNGIKVTMDKGPFSKALSLFPTGVFIMGMVGATLDQHSKDTRIRREASQLDALAKSLVLLTPEACEQDSVLKLPVGFSEGWKALHCKLTDCETNGTDHCKEQIIDIVTEAKEKQNQLVLVIERVFINWADNLGKKIVMEVLPWVENTPEYDAEAVAQSAGELMTLAKIPPVDARDPLSVLEDSSSDPFAF